MLPDTAERRPVGRGSAQDEAHGGGNVTLTIPNVADMDTLTAAFASR